MSQEPKKKMNPDEVTALLKQAAKKRRPWTLGSSLGCLLLVAVPLGLFLWWVWPRGPGPTFLLLTFDEVAVEGRPVTLRAVLLPADEESAEAELEGREVHFEEFGPPGGASPRWAATAAADGGGRAEAECTPPAGRPVYDFVALHKGGKDRAASDRGRVFSWPAGATLLLVDVEGTLTDAPAKVWLTQSAADIPRDRTAVAALQHAAAKYRVAYVSLSSDLPLPQRKVRDWVQRGASAPDSPLPDGPVLGRTAFPDPRTEDRARRDLAADLTKRFTGQVVAVTARPQAAESYAAAGVKTYLVSGEKQAPKGVSQVADWAALAAQLKQASK